MIPRFKQNRTRTIPRALLWAGNTAVSKILDFTKSTSWSRDKLKANKQE